MDYKYCEYYSQGYCMNGEKTANGMNYPCIERNDCPEVAATYRKLQYAKPKIYYPKRPLYKKTCTK